MWHVRHLLNPNQNLPLSFGLIFGIFGISIVEKRHRFSCRRSCGPYFRNGCQGQGSNNTRWYSGLLQTGMGIRWLQSIGNKLQISSMGRQKWWPRTYERWWGQDNFLFCGCNLDTFLLYLYILVNFSLIS